ncbi:hypothetical protein Z950_3543 [Sulfitobacter mediterraneus KCTC 32188]|nr:hypothetical protein Z950_3543 [Sulfitobacter mediterraneus KCTC 32188]
MHLRLPPCCIVSLPCICKADARPSLPPMGNGAMFSTAPTDIDNDLLLI